MCVLSVQLHNVEFIPEIKLIELWLFGQHKKANEEKQETNFLGEAQNDKVSLFPVSKIFEYIPKYYLRIAQVSVGQFTNLAPPKRPQ